MRRGALALAVALALVGGLCAPAVADLAPPPAPTIEAAPGGWPTALGIEAAAYVLLDARTGQVLAARDAELRRPVASTVKVLTALSVLERVGLDDEVTVGPEVLGVAGSGVGLAPGDVWTVEQLLDGLIARSGNDAAEALAVHVAGDTASFVELMRADAAAMGLGEVPLVSPSGLDDANLLSALDLATVTRVALAHPQLREILGRGRVVLPSEGSVETRNTLLLTYRGATGVKTGFTALAGNSLIGSAERGGRELIAVVLGGGEDPARFEVAARLLDLGFERFEEAELAATLQLALAGGSAVLTVAPTLVVTPVGAAASLSLPVPRRVPDEAIDVPVVVDGTARGTARASLEVAVAPAPSDDAQVGRSVVDGAYAALRAASAAGRLG